MSFTRDNIITLPNKHLRQRSSKVGLINDDIRDIVDKMKQATLDWEDHREHEIGVALAAIQIDKKLRIVIVRNSFEDKADREFQVFINPEITKYDGDLVADYEGCLSIKDTYGLVERHDKIKLKAKNLEGREIRLTAQGFLARVLQHEIDHTNGVLFIDHIKDNPEAYFKLDTEGKLHPLDYSAQIKDNPNLWSA